MGTSACRVCGRMWFLPALCIGITGLAPHAAQAQGLGGVPTGLGLQGNAPSFTNEQLSNSLKQARPPPAALPGAQRSGRAVAPPERVPSLLSPNEALFDAINRGDITGVRDSLSRGADLNTQDELGMTPLDLSIDLGRNDISFLLLSLRAADSGPTGPSQTGPSQTGPSQIGPSQAVAALRAPAKPDRTAIGERRSLSVWQMATASRQRRADMQTLPKLFSGDGGAPIPQAGFLGFSGR